MADDLDPARPPEAVPAPLPDWWAPESTLGPSRPPGAVPAAAGTPLHQRLVERVHQALWELNEAQLLTVARSLARVDPVGVQAVIRVVLADPRSERLEPRHGAQCAGGVVLTDGFCMVCGTYSD